MTAAEVIDVLGLTPLTIEGGYYRETYRSRQTIPRDILPSGYSGARSCSTAIYYLLTPDTFSHMHRLVGDEVFHFYLGDPVTMLRLDPDRSSEILTLGSDIISGHQVQVIVPGGIWQGMKLADGGMWALMGTTVAPGFDAVDYEQGDRGELTALYPDRADLIRQLTIDTHGA